MCEWDRRLLPPTLPGRFTTGTHEMEWETIIMSYNVLASPGPAQSVEAQETKGRVGDHEDSEDPEGL